MKPFWVYILRCADDSYYTGHTDDLVNRLGEHQIGICNCYTFVRRPVSLIWSQETDTREEAIAAELRIKGWSRKKKEAMMRGDWQAVNQLGRGKHQHQRKQDAAKPTVRPEPFGLAQDELHVAESNDKDLGLREYQSAPASTPEAKPPTLSTNGTEEL